MNSSTTQKAALRVWLCFATLVFSVITAAAQPSTTTVQNGGNPNATNPQIVSNYTVPRAGIVLPGTALNAQGFPVRHLWIGDNVMGFCRVDPDVDTPGIRVINPNTCPFKLNGLSFVGGPASYDPTTRFVYVADARRSLGIFRLKYDPTADGGNGNIDLTSIFGLAGNPTNARFQGGQTGCPLPNAAVIAGVALGPDGNLYGTQGKGGLITRINNPATADTVGFGTCADFVQVVATSPDGKTTGDLAFIGHDLWSVDGTSPFVIPNADTTCQAITPTMTTTCPGFNLLAAVGAANTTASDQLYPYLNGNNLYYGLSAAVIVPPFTPANVFWVADAQGAQTVTSNFISPTDITASLPPTLPPAFPLGAMGQSAVDYNDPANFVVYTGDDPSNNGITIPPTISGAPGLGLGRWWQTCLGKPPLVPNPFATNVLTVNNCPTPAASAAPGAPTVARAKATGSNVTVSWSAAQSQLPVSSYRLRTFLNGVQQPDTFISPAAGKQFPATYKTLLNAANGSYAFQVSAINASGESGLSTLSAAVSVPEIDAPGIPTRLVATAADTAALVSWFPPAIVGGAPITSYTITAIDGNVRTAITSLVPAPGTPGQVNGVIAGLTNGHTYSFTVHATNVGGSSLESTPSNTVVPAFVAALSSTMGGPTSLTTTPIQVTYPITIKNNGILPVTSLTLVDTLATTDGAFIILAQPTQGSCGSGGLAVTTVTCNLGTLGAGQTAQVNVIVQIQGAAVTNSAAITALDNASTLLSTSSSTTTAPPPPPTTSVTAAISVQGNAQVPNPNVGQAGNIVWTISNTTQNGAANVAFETIVPSTGSKNMALNSITVTINNNGTFVCTFIPNGGAPVPCASAPTGTGGGLIQVTTPTLGGSTKNGQKPPQTLIVTVNVTDPAGTTTNTVFSATGTVTFGPGGVDTLPNSATVRITSR
ncbi:MAG TPA: fibronectin type III domain-containing protein [Candidatus Angelobacter sp.]|nr:fibronectin type III domain-containing protein [Candidatus Angelobacter sp.]